MNESINQSVLSSIYNCKKKYESIRSFSSWKEKQTIRAMPRKNHCQIVQRTRGVFNPQICSTITNEEVTSDSLHVGTVGHKSEQDS